MFSPQTIKAQYLSYDIKGRLYKIQTDLSYIFTVYIEYKSEKAPLLILRWCSYYHCYTVKKNWKSNTFFRFICIERLTLSLRLIRKSRVFNLKKDFIIFPPPNNFNSSFPHKNSNRSKKKRGLSLLNASLKQQLFDQAETATHMDTGFPGPVDQIPFSISPWYFRLGY